MLLHPHLKSSALAAAILLAPSAIAVAAQSPPDRPEEVATERVHAFFEAASSRSQTRLAAWAEANLTRREDAGPAADFAERILRMYVEWGGFDLESIEAIRTDGTLVSLHALGHTPADDRWIELQFGIGPAPEYRLARIFMNLSAPPAELPEGTIDDARVWRWLEDYLTGLADSQGFSGGMLVARGDSIVAEAYGGPRDRETGIANDAASKFGIGSGGKMFTATALVRLAERGVVDLDVPISTYLPDYRDADFARKATLRHLLTHRSGLGDYWDDDYEAAWDTIRTHEALLEHIDPPASEPGERFAYSNSGYALAGRIAEVVTGEDFYSLVGEEVFRPAGMDPDAYPLRTASGPEVARPYESDGSPARGGLRGSAAGGAQVTLRDVWRFQRALWGGRLVSDSALRMMTEPRWLTGRGDRYGLGFFADENPEGMMEIGHGGAAPGAYFMFGYLPEVDLSFVLATNRTGGGLETMQEFIRELAARSATADPR